MIVVARVSDHLSQSTCLEMLHPKTDEHVNPSVEVHHLVGKLSMAETLLRWNVKVYICRNGGLFKKESSNNLVMH